MTMRWMRMRSQGMVRLKTRMGKGMTKQRTTMIQKRGAYFPVSLLQKTASSSESSSIAHGQVFGKGEIEPEEGEGEEEQAHVVEVVGGEIVLQVIDSSEGDGHDDDRCDARKDGAGHEIGGKDGAVPHGLGLHSEDPGDHRVDTDGDGDDGDAENGDDLSQNSLLAFRSGPSEGKRLVEPSPPETGL